MTITITREDVNTAVLLFLIAMQVYQWTVVKKLEKESDSIWDQLAKMALGISTQLGIFQKDLDKKENKKSG